MTFRDARLKIDRANKHIEEIKTAVLCLHEAYISVIESDANTGGHSIKYKCPDLEDRLLQIALMTGDAVHNLRTALDYAWIATIDSLRLPQTRYTKFPFTETLKMLQDQLAERQINTANPILFEKLTADIKPYRAGNLHLWALHSLDITDKHKLLLPLVNYAGADGIRVEDEHGTVHPIELMPRTGGTNVMFLDFLPNIKIKEKGHIAASILFDEGPMGGFPIPEELLTLSYSAFSVIESLEAIPT